MRGQATMAIVLVIAVISGIIGLGIIDALVADAVTPATANNESHTITSAPETVTLSNHPIVTSANGGTLTLMNQWGNWTLTEGTEYTVSSYPSGTISVLDYTPATNGTLLVTYTYGDGTYYSSSLARTIAIYVVPIGMLGILAFVAMRG